METTRLKVLLMAPGLVAAMLAGTVLVLMTDDADVTRRPPQA